MTIALIALGAGLFYAARVVSVGALYGGVTGVIPVLSEPIEDFSDHGFAERPSRRLRAQTVVVALTPKAFYFGDLAAFSDGFADVRNKYGIRHVDGEPQLQTLMTQLEAWMARRQSGFGIKGDGIVVLMPSGEIPVPIITQVMAGLRSSEQFKDVVLGSGLL